MTTTVERIMELYRLKSSLEAQLQDVKCMLDDCLREAYEEEGCKELSDGYTIRRSETRDISVKLFRERYPAIYEKALSDKVAAYKPELTKTDVKKAIGAEVEGKVRTKAEQARILEDIEDGMVTVKYAIVKPLDPHAKEVVE